MTPERWQQVSELYHAVLEAEPSRRAVLLESADPEVRREVEALLSSSDSETSPLERDGKEGLLIADLDIATATGLMAARYKPV
jgi:hypothetical protein